VPASGGHISFQDPKRIIGDPRAIIQPNLVQSGASELAGDKTMHHGEKKRRAATAALQCVKPGAILGVGTGSTVNYFIDLLPDIREKIDVVVASSAATEKRLSDLNFEVSPLSETGALDLYVDGADEANKHFHLIKGGGGALTREKVLAGAAREFVCIIDDSKWVGVLGKFPLPVEVIPMARSFVARQFVKARGQPVLREDFLTDNNNEVLDIYNLTITNPVEMELRFSQIPGVVTVGIFAHRPADRVIMADDNGDVQEMTRA
jgi:ribose 5-phosphate isomerase A